MGIHRYGFTKIKLLRLVDEAADFPFMERSTFSGSISRKSFSKVRQMGIEVDLVVSI